MQSKWMRRLGMAALFGTVAYASFGCAEERDPRNYVQPNAIDKTFFVGANVRDVKDDPEFYMRNTLIDVPMGAGDGGMFTSTYAQPLNRIKWDIQEDRLIARMTHERIDNSDHKGSRRTNDGQIAAMFAITSHFDVKRSYNPGTGEDLNIVEENTSDRPWYDRQYIRVDWSQNLVTDAYALDTLSQLGASGAKYSPIAYRIEDPNDPNRPLFEPSEGYLDVTQKAFASPEIWHTQWGDYPACFFSGQGPVTNCNPTELTLRLSFKKVVDTDYEPVEWDGKKMDAFGAFYEERFGYDRNFGLVDQNWHRYAALHNIWEKSHIEGSQCGVDFWRDEDGAIATYKKDGDEFARDPATGMPIPDPKGERFQGTAVGKDPNRDESRGGPDDGKGTGDDCEFRDGSGNLLHKGAYCDVASKKCSLPLYERKLRSSAWYYGPSSHNDLFPSTNDALNQWNIAAKQAAVLGMKAEAERVGVGLDVVAKNLGADVEAIEAIVANAGDEDRFKSDKDQADSERRLPLIPDLFVLCHNPTVETDHPACFKKAGDGSLQPVYARVGDIRYHSVNLIEGPQSGSPWGIMSDAVDPLTGEKVAASVNEWVQVLDFVAQQNIDLIRWINGEISDEQVKNGEYLRDWVRTNQLGDAPHMSKTLTKAEVDSRVNSVDLTLQKMNGLKPEDRSLPLPIRVQKAHENLARNLGPSATPDLEAARQKLVGSPWEAKMVTPEMLEMAGLPPNGLAGDDRTLAMASPLRGKSPALRKWFERSRAIGLAQRHSCVVEQPEPNGLVGLARLAARQFPNPDPSKGGACAYDNALDQKADYPACKNAHDKRLFQWIREQFHRSVIAHEMGHSMALRHNFTGSADAFNYHQEYWQLRTRNGEEKACENLVEPHINGKDCVGPRWLDPITEDEVNGIIWKYASTTVMDYPGDITGDMIGLGAYDKAAMRFMYGRVVDVEEDAVIGTPKGTAFVGELDGPNYYGAAVGDIHYSRVNEEYKLIDKDKRKCTPRSPDKAGSTNPLDFKCDRYSKEGPNVPIGAGKRLLHPSFRDMQTTPKYPQSDPAVNDLLLKLRPDLVSNFAVYEVPNPSNPKQPRRMVRHPYMFSSDEYADSGNIPVYRHDGGADVYEMMQFLITSYENRYIFDNFRRNRATFTTNGAAQRVMARYWDKIHGMAKALFLRQQSADSKALENANELLPMVLASADAFEMFTRALTRPEPGTYVLDKSGPITMARTLNPSELEANPSGDFRISAGYGEGRFVNNDYDYSKGENWHQYPLVAGSWFEKYIALYYILEAENNYVSNSKEDYIDGRYKNTNFASIYPDQVRRLLSQLVQGDMATLGPYTAVNTGTLANNKLARVQYLPWNKWDTKDAATINLDYPADAVVLNPLYGWNQQQAGIQFMFWFGNTKLTLDLAQQLRIFSTGDGSTVSLLPSEQIRYTDPFTSITYVARDYGTETVNARVAPVMRTPGARMLQYANQLAAKTFQTSAKDPVTGELTYAKDAGGNPVCKAGVDCAASSSKLRNYSSNIDTVRQMSLFWGYGPL